MSLPTCEKLELTGCLYSLLEVNITFIKISPKHIQSIFSFRGELVRPVLFAPKENRYLIGSHIKTCCNIMLTENIHIIQDTKSRVGGDQPMLVAQHNRNWNNSYVGYVLKDDIDFDGILSFKEHYSNTTVTYK